MVLSFFFFEKWKRRYRDLSWRVFEIWPMKLNLLFSSALWLFFQIIFSDKISSLVPGLTDNGIPPNSLNLWGICLKKAYIYRTPFWTTDISLKSTPCWVFIPSSYPCISVNVQPLTRRTTLRRLCFTERGAPLEVCTARYASGWHWLPSKFDVKQHRWRENSHVSQVDQQMAEC